MTVFCLYLKVPCVGISVGIERIFSILEAKAEVSLVGILCSFVLLRALTVLATGV